MIEVTKYTFGSSAQARSPSARPASLARTLLHFGLSLALLIVPTAMTFTLLANKNLGPLVSMSYILAIAMAGWFFGFAAALFLVAASIVSLTAIATGGKQFVPPHIDYA